jgi:hypothetical protein
MTLLAAGEAENGKVYGELGGLILRNPYFSA